MEKQLRKKEEGLFLEQMRIEVNAKDEIENLQWIKNINLEKSLVFKINIQTFF